MCCVFICTNSRHTWKHLCAAHSIGESHAMTTPSICCVFICTNPNQTSILGSGRNLQLPRAKKKLIEVSFKILSHLLASTGFIDLRFEQGLLEVCTYAKPACQSFATWSVPAIVKCPMGRVFRVCSRFVHMKAQHVRVLAASVLFLSRFRGRLMLAHVAGSVSTDLNVGRKTWQIHVSHRQSASSATTASVVWLLASDFIFKLCVSPCPGILSLDALQTRSFLDWSHTDAFDFSRWCLYQHWVLGTGGGSSLNLISGFEKYCDAGDSWVYLLSVNMIQKKRCMIFDSCMMTHEESHVLRWLKNGTLC